jgi:S-DNA-T family DNA segregation ATPase FtsK/SpoIIIE
VTVRRWVPGVARTAAPGADGGPTDLDLLVTALGAAAAGRPAPHRPWAPPLPARLTWDSPALAADAQAGAGPALGLVDRPDQQRQEPLRLDLDAGGGWLAVGGPRSGRSTLLSAVLAAAAHALPPDRLHVHVLDHGGGALAAEAAPLAHTGTAVGAGDALRTVRLLDRLAAEVAERRAAPAAGASRARLLLLVDGVESLSAQLDEADPAGGSAALHRLVREGAAAGLTCVLTADRAVPGSRLAAAATTRLVLPLPDRADYAVAGVPARAVPSDRPPGRALLGEDALEVQLALPRPLPPASPGTERTALRIVELPADPEPVGAGSPAPAAGVPLVVGPGGDDGDALSVDLVRSGGLLVVGPPGSGRTTALRAFADDLVRRGLPVIRLEAGPAGAVRAGGGHDRAAGIPVLPPDDGAALGGWLAGLPAGAPAVVVADDVRGAAAWSALAGPVLDGAGRPTVLLAAGTAADLTAHYQGPLAALRRSRTGLLLRPGPAEADVLGVRLPRTPVPPRPGSGWLVEGGLPTRVQVARRRVSA